MNHWISVHRWTLVKGEIQIRWPTLSLTSLSLEVTSPDVLATVLSEHMGFSPRRAIAEAAMFWKDLEEKFRQAT
jgi:hypothetical protein